VLLWSKNHFYFPSGPRNHVHQTLRKRNYKPQFWEEDRQFKLQFSVSMARHHHTRKDTMTSHTQEMQNAVCVKVPYLVCSTGVLSFHTLKLVFCIICKPRSHITFHSSWVHDVTASPPVQQWRTIKPENRSLNQRSPSQNQRLQPRLGSVQQTQPRNPKKKQKWFFDHSSTLSSAWAKTFQGASWRQFFSESAVRHWLLPSVMANRKITTEVDNEMRLWVVDEFR